MTACRSAPSSASALLNQDGAADATAAGGVERVLNGHVILDDDGRDLRILHVGGHLGSHLEVHHVAGVVFDDVQDALAGVHLGRRFYDLIGHGGGEDLAAHGRIEHAGADEPGVKRLVAGATAGNDGDLAILGLLAVNDMVLEVDLEEIGVSESRALERFGDHVIGVIN